MSLFPLFLVIFVDVLGFTVLIPLLPFIAEKYGATPVQVGALMASFAFFQFFSGPVLGDLSDRFGRRPILLISQIGTFIGSLIVAFAGSLPLLFLGRIIDGITAGNYSVAQAYIADVTPPENRTKKFALIGLAFGLGFLVGPGISGALYQIKPQLPLLLAAFLSFVSVVCTYFFLPEPKVTRSISELKKPKPWDFSNYANWFRKPKVGPRLKQFLFFQLAFSLFFSGFPLYAERRLLWHGEPFGVSQVSAIYAYAGLIGAFIQGGMIKHLVKYFGERKLALTGFIGMALGYIALAWTSQLWELLVAAAVASYGTAVVRPSLTSLISQDVDNKEQGVALGLTQSMSSMASILAPLISGFFIGQSWIILWACTATAFAMGGVVLDYCADQRGEVQSPNP